MNVWSCTFFNRPASFHGELSIGATVFLPLWKEIGYEDMAGAREPALGHS
jgi:hypothetical protein